MAVRQRDRRYLPDLDRREFVTPDSSSRVSNPPTHLPRRTISQNPNQHPSTLPSLPSSPFIPSVIQRTDQPRPCPSKPASTAQKQTPTATARRSTHRNGKFCRISTRSQRVATALSAPPRSAPQIQTALTNSEPAPSKRAQPPGPRTNSILLPSPLPALHSRLSPLHFLLHYLLTTTNRPCYTVPRHANTCSLQSIPNFLTF